MSSRSYRSFDEFAREELRPGNRIGFSLDELDLDEGYGEELCFDDKDDDDEDEE